MINFNKEEERVPSVLIVFSLLILIGSLIYMVAVPKPTSAGIATKRQRSIIQLQGDVDKTDEQIGEMDKSMRPRLWKEGAGQITPLVLAQITKQAVAQKVKVTAFRPQRIQAFDGVTEMPYSVYLTGTYPQLNAVLKSIDRPESKIVIRSEQIASSDPKTSTSTAVVGISVFYESAEAAPTAKTEASNGKN